MRPCMSELTYATMMDLILVVIGIPALQSLQACAHRKEPRPVFQPGFDQFLVNSYQLVLCLLFDLQCMCSETPLKRT